MKKIYYPLYFLLGLFLIAKADLLKAQTEYIINGQLLDERAQPVMFANVTLLSCADSSIIAGTVSDDTGKFELVYNKPGSYLLSARFIGFKPFQRKIGLYEDQHLELDDIVMTATLTQLNEVVITQERMKAKQEADKTTYYVNKAILSASNTGVDILQHIPDVQVDMFQNISLDGSRNIAILVDGVERPADFLAQISSEKIDRIEIKKTPDGQHEGEITGVINVVMKENRNTGISGNLHASIPTASDEVYSFPTANLTYVFGKITLYSSYSGEFSFFDIETEDRRIFSMDNRTVEIIKKENLLQQNWSHKLHFGADYFCDKNNQVSVYGFISRFSNEQSGDFHISKSNNESGNQITDYKQDDHDINTSAYSSVYYKHTFNEGTELSFDANYYLLQSENKLHLWSTNSETEHLSQMQPRNNLLSARLDLRFSLNDRTGLIIGVNQSLDHSSDASAAGFNHSESTSAAYFAIDHSKKNLHANASMRTEYSRYLNDDQKEGRWVILPSMHLKYSFTSGKHLRFSYRQGIVRPSVFQLIPNLQTLDTYMIKKGNKELEPSMNYNINIDFSTTFDNSFLTAGVFYTYQKDVIETLTTLKEEQVLLKEIENLGNISRLGVTTSGSFQLQKNITLNPHISVYRVQTHVNELARANNIQNRSAIDLKSALSAMYLMKHDLAISFSIQYNSRQTHIQNDYYEQALYFISLEKTFFDRLKVGMTAANPFSKTFTYLGYDISGQNFIQTTEENIQMSVMPLWFNLSYTFSSGQDAKRIRYDNSFKENKPKKGF